MDASNSEYVKFWNEEIRRCWYGMTRPSDGEWITGYHYFYLNYGVIRKNILTKGSKRASRANDSFPDFYDGDYWYDLILKFPEIHLSVMDTDPDTKKIRQKIMAQTDDVYERVAAIDKAIKEGVE